MKKVILLTLCYYSRRINLIDIICAQCRKNDNSVFDQPKREQNGLCCPFLRVCYASHTKPSWKGTGKWHFLR